jgi:hypothetical protein
MRKETAVDFLGKIIPEILGDLCNQMTEAQTLKMHYAFKEAKNNHKKQIINAWLDGGATLGAKNAEQYYQQNYEEEIT